MRSTVGILRLQAGEDVKFGCRPASGRCDLNLHRPRQRRAAVGIPRLAGLFAFPMLAPHIGESEA
jgi:hypothetical protein